MINMDRSCLDRTHVQQPKPLMEPGPVFDRCSTSLAAPLANDRIKPFRKRTKTIYSKWASKRSDHKVVLQKQKEITPIESHSTPLLPPKKQTPASSLPDRNYTSEMSVSLQVDCSKLELEVEDKNKVFKTKLQIILISI
jgi:hypothetical protein